MIARRSQPFLRAEDGQALVESGILLATLIGGLALGGAWLMRAHPDMLRALDAHVRGSYFLLSLPFP
jgi:hypothetical protein